MPQIKTEFTFFLTSHIFRKALARSWYFSTFSSSVSPTRPSSGIATSIIIIIIIIVIIIIIIVIIIIIIIVIIIIIIIIVIIIIIIIIIVKLCTHYLSSQRLRACS